MVIYLTSLEVYVCKVWESRSYLPHLISLQKMHDVILAVFQLQFVWYACIVPISFLILLTREIIGRCHSQCPLAASNQVFRSCALVSSRCRPCQHPISSSESLQVYILHVSMNITAWWQCNKLWFPLPSSAATSFKRWQPCPILYTWGTLRAYPICPK